MTEPQPVMDQSEQDRLTRQIGRALLTVAGQDWKHVRAEYRSAGRHVEVDVLVTGPDDQPRPVRPPQEVVDGFGRLRQGMYRPGRGTWLSALYLLDPPSSFSAEFEPDVEPRWRRVPPPIGFADELRFFPRADEHVPEWFRRRAGLPPVDAEQPPAGRPTPPAGTQGPGTTPGGTGQPGHATPPAGIRQPATPPGGTQQPGRVQPSGPRRPSGPHVPPQSGPFPPRTGTPPYGGPVPQQFHPDSRPS